MNFLSHFGKTADEKIIVYDIFTFSNLFSLLLYDGLSHDEALSSILANFDLNGYVFQECIHNSAYLNLTAKQIDFTEAGRRSMLHQMALSFMS